MIVAWASLFVAAIGLGGLYTAALGTRAPHWIASVIGTIPWFVVFALTFVNAPPPLSARGLRRCLLFVMSWYAAGVVIAEALNLLGCVPIPARSPHAILVFRICMHVGWLSFFPLVRWYKAVGRAAGPV